MEPLLLVSMMCTEADKRPPQTEWEGVVPGKFMLQTPSECSTPVIMHVCVVMVVVVSKGCSVAEEAVVLVR